MKKANQIKALMGTLSLLLVAVVVSCTRNLSVPVAALVNTSTPTFTKTPTVAAPTSTPTNSPTGLNTQTATSTSTTANTQTSTPTSSSTSTVTPLGNTYTSTSTQTVTNTQTNTSTAPPTSTSTSTNTAGNTSTATATPTMTNTVPAGPTNTPSTLVDFDDFDEVSSGGSNYWDSAISLPGYICGTQNNGAGVSGSSVTVDTNNYYGTSTFCTSGNCAAYVVQPQSIAVTIGNFGSAAYPNEGTVSVIPQCLVPNGAAIYEGNCGALPGNSFSVMLYGDSGGPMTITSVILADSNSNELIANLQATSSTFVIPTGTWGDLVIPMSSFGLANAGPCPGCQGTLAGLEADGPYAIYIQVAGPVGGTGKFNMDNIIFY